MKLRYGKRRPYLEFASEADFYECYGFLCNPKKHGLDFQWEYNEGSGAWGNEGRIHFLNLNGRGAYSPIPASLSRRLTAGLYGTIANRLNCNEFVEELVEVFGFEVNPAKPGNQAMRSAQGLIPPSDPKRFVPARFLPDYERGYDL